MHKTEVDQSLWQEALVLDRDVYNSPLRPGTEKRCVYSRELFEPVLVLPRPHLDALRFLPAALTYNRRNKTAYAPVPDGSLQTFAAVSSLGKSDVPFSQAVNQLHRLGLEGYLREILLLRNVLRLAENGVRTDDIPGKYRTITAAFDYGVFNCSHPNVIEMEMHKLGAKIDATTGLICNSGGDFKDVDTQTLRKGLRSSRFCTEERVAGLTDKELVGYLMASETQRITAYIHPWFERVGRTTEEGMALFATRCGIPPLYLSDPNNRFTQSGYERGIINAVTAVGILREIGGRFGLNPQQVSEIYRIDDIYQCLDTPAYKRAVYRSPLKYINSSCIFPDSEIMRKYYEETHSIVMGLIDTFDIPSVAVDPCSVYLASHLIGRGKSI